MKKLLTLTLILTLPLFLSACTKKQTNENPTPNNTQSMEETVKGNIKDLLGLNKNLKCTYELSDENTNSKATMYISGNKARTDNEFVDNEGTTIESHSIIDGEYLYTWSNMSEQGTKFKMTDMEEMSEEYVKEETAEYSYKDLNQEFDYKCVIWVRDDSKFEVPSNIEFADYTQFLEDIKSNMGNMQQTGCSACNMLPEGDQRNECLENLGCN